MATSKKKEEPTTRSRTRDRCGGAEEKTVTDSASADSAGKKNSQDRISAEKLQQFREALRQMERNEREPWRHGDPNDAGDFLNWPYLLIRFLFRHPSVTRFLLSVGMLVWSLKLIFAAASPLSWLQASCEAGMFAVGLTGIAWAILPGKVSFKKAGITAAGALALFLAMLFWLKSGSHEDTGASTTVLPKYFAVLVLRDEQFR